MALSLLQEYCLGVMGITQWQLKSEMKEQPKPYLLLLSEPLTEEKKQLLSRLIQALKWPQEMIQIEVLTSWARETIETMVQKYQVQKLVIFNEQINFSSKNSASVAIASVEEMLKNVEAKKRAWRKLQSLIETGPTQRSAPTSDPA